VESIPRRVKAAIDAKARALELAAKRLAEAQRKEREEIKKAKKAAKVALLGGSENTTTTKKNKKVALGDGVRLPSLPYEDGWYLQSHLTLMLIGSPTFSYLYRYAREFVVALVRLVDGRQLSSHREKDPEDERVVSCSFVCGCNGICIALYSSNPGCLVSPDAETNLVYEPHRKVPSTLWFYLVWRFFRLLEEGSG